MRIHSLDKIKRLKELRKNGYSINELVREFSIPKTTVWHHIHSIVVEPKYVSLLKSKRGGSALKKQKNWQISKELAENLLHSPNRECVMVLAMLYWAEGSKKECVFTNSDSRMIDLYIKIIVKVFNIAKDRIVPTVRIFSGMDERKCLDYWAKVIDFPKDR